MMTTASASRQLARGLVRTIGDEPGRTTIVCSSLATLETLTTLARQNRGLSLFIQRRSDRHPVDYWDATALTGRPMACDRIRLACGRLDKPLQETERMEPPGHIGNGNAQQVSDALGVTTFTSIAAAPTVAPRGRDPLVRAQSRPDPRQWADDEPMTLAEAAAVFFPDGRPLTLRSLRTAADTGELAIAKVAGKNLTTPGAVRAMLTPKRSAKSADSRRSNRSSSTEEAKSTPTTAESTLRAIRQSLQSHRPTKAGL